MNWRFFPTLDPQVDIYLCRDLDSRPSQREVAAVREWLRSGLAIHSMRDNPAHDTPLLGASWGARLDTEAGTARSLWAGSWAGILRDNLTYADRDFKGPDQTILTVHVWPWARSQAMQHDSYTCDETKFLREHHCVLIFIYSGVLVILALSASRPRDSMNQTTL